MALDHPQKVIRLALLDIIPTHEVTERITFQIASKMHQWWMLSQPYPFPETLMMQNNELILGYILDNWAGDVKLISQKARAEYSRCFKKPEVIRAMCEDYRGGSSIDIQDDL